MEINLTISDEIVEKLWEEQQKRIAAAKTELDRAFIEIWSKEEIVKAHVITLIKLYHEGKILRKEQR